MSWIAQVLQCNNLKCVVLKVCSFVSMHLALIMTLRLGKYCSVSEEDSNLVSVSILFGFDNIRLLTRFSLGVIEQYACPSIIALMFDLSLGGG